MADTVREAIRNGADLSIANLSGLNLTGVDLSYINLRGASLSRSNLSYADLRGTDLRNSWTFATMWDGTKLDGVQMNWRSHGLIAEILARAARKDVMKLSLAGIIQIKHDWCWDDFIKLKHPETSWAIEELRRWITPDDDHPRYLD
jgi:uncharacterized protein YjbI with pentapeptide repeats